MTRTRYFFIYVIVGILFVGGVFLGITSFLANRKSDVTIVKTGMSSESEQNSSQNVEFSENNKINISKISVSAPISFNIDGNNMEQYMRALEKGVDHLKGTALPGENGNAVIFGHSSYYKNKPGNFKTVFIKLDSLAAGDNVSIVFNGTTYNYIVSEQKIVDPGDISVVSQSTNKKILTLITCWPPKTTDKRLVIVAEMK